MRWWSAAALASAALLAQASLAHAGGPSVGAGNGTITTNGTTTTIVQTTDKAIYNWPSLQVPYGSTLQYIEPNSASIALNRVTGGGTSFINGSLLANGQVWIINPAGVLFGRNASVNVAGLIATTTDISDSNFLSGNYSFDQPSANAAAGVVNQGNITVGTGGSAALAGARVNNSGIISAQLGEVVLASGATFAVDFDGDKLLSFAVNAPVTQTPTLPNGTAASSLVANSGTLSAEGGTVLLTARAARSVVTNAINTTGMIAATTAYDDHGTIVLDAGAGGTASVGGTLDASGKAAGETGGSIAITGGTVEVASGALLDASGDAGGGTIAVGGDLHGAGPLADAQNTLVSPGATLNASAVTSGAGGTVSVWSNGTTVFDGAILARGGAVETSGEGYLVVGPDASVQAASWLLDPNSNVTISNAALGISCLLNLTCLPILDGSTVAASTLVAGLNAGDTVTVGTSDAIGTQAGTITVASAIAETSVIGTVSSLELNAASSIFVNASISAASAMNVVLSSTSGSITISSPITTDSGTFNANANAASQSVTVASGGSVNATLTSGSTTGGGTVTLQANGSDGSIAVNGGVSGPSSMTIQGGAGGSFSMGGSGAALTVSGGNTLTVEADGLSITSGSSITGGTGTFVLETVQNATTLGIGSGAGTFQVTPTAIGAISGFSLLDITNAFCCSAGAGATNIGGTVAFGRPTTIDSSGPITVASNAALSVGTGQTFTLASVQNTAGQGGNVVLNSGSTLSAGTITIDAAAGSLTDNVAYTDTSSAGVVASLSSTGTGATTSVGGSTTAGSALLDLELSAPAAVTFTGTATLNGGAFFANATGTSTTATIGAGANLSGASSISMTASGTGGSIAVNGAIAGTAISLTGGAGGSFSMGGSGASITTTGASGVTIEADSLSIASGSVISGGTGTLTLETAQATTTLGIGTGTGAFQVTQTALNAITGFNLLSITNIICCAETTESATTIDGSVAFGRPTTITSSGPMTVNGTAALSVGTGQALTLETEEIVAGQGGLITLTPGSTISAGNVTVDAQQGGISYGATYTDTSAGSANFELETSGTAANIAVNQAIASSGGALATTFETNSGSITVGANVATHGGTLLFEANGAGSVLTVNSGATVSTTGGSAGLTLEAEGASSSIAINGAVNSGLQMNIIGGAGGSLSMGGSGASLSVLIGDALTIQVDGLSIASGSVISGGTGTLTLETIGPSTTMGIGTGAGTFEVNQTALSAISGFNQMSITNLICCSSTASAATTIDGSVAFGRTTTVESSGAVTVAATAALSVPAAATLTVESAVDFTGQGGNVTINSGATISAGSFAATAAAGSLTYGAAFTDIATASSTFALDATGTGGNVTLSAPVAAGSSPLAVTLAAGAGAVTVGANVTTGGGEFLAEATGTNGSVTVNAGATVNETGAGASGAFLEAAGSGGSVAINGAVTSGASLIAEGGAGGTVSMGGSGASLTVSGTNALTIQGDGLSIAAGSAITGGTGTVTLETVQPATTMGIGTGAGTFQVTQTALNALSGFNALDISNLICCSSSAAGATTIDGSVAFGRTTTVQSSGGVTVNATAAITMPVGSTLTISSAVDFAGQGGNVTFDSGATITASSFASTAAAGALSFGATFTDNATAAATFALSTTGNGNNLSTTSPISAGSAALSVSMNSGGGITVGGNVTTDGGTFSAISSGTSATIGVNSGTTINTTGTGSQTATLDATGSGGSISISGAVSAGATSTLETGAGGAFDLASGGSVSVSGTSILTIEADSLAIASGGAINGGTGTLVLDTAQPGTTMGIGTGAGSFQVTQTALNVISGFNTQTISNLICCSSSAAAAATIDGTVQFGRPTTVTSSGPITVAATAALGVPTGQSLTLQSAVDFSGQGGNVTINSGATISAGAFSATAATGALSYGAAFTDTSATASNFSLTATGTGGSVAVSNAVSSGTAPLNVALTAGAGITVGGNIATGSGTFAATSSGASAVIALNAGSTINTTGSGGSATLAMTASGSGGSITINGGASAGSTMTLVGGVGGTFTLGSTGSLAVSGTNNMILGGDTLSVASGGTITGGTGVLTLETVSPGATMGIGTGSGTFEVTQGVLNDVTGFSALTISNVICCSSSASGGTTIDGTLALGRTATIFSTGPITAAATAALSVPANQTLTIETVEDFAGQGGGITLNTGSSITASFINVTAQSGTVTFGSTFTDNATAASTFSLDATGTGNAVNLDSAVAAGSAPLGITLTSNLAGVTVAAPVTTGGGSVNISASTGGITVNTGDTITTTGASGGQAISLSDTVAGAGIVINAALAAGNNNIGIQAGTGAIMLSGALSTTGGSINVNGTGNISITQPVTAVGGNVTVNNSTGTSVNIGINGANIRAEASLSDVTNTGTVTVTGNVSEVSSVVSAGLGHVVTLESIPTGNITISNSTMDAGDVTLAPGTSSDVIFNANSSLIATESGGEAGNVFIYNARNVTMNTGSSIQADGGLIIGGSGPITGNVILNNISLDHNNDGNGSGGMVGMTVQNVAGTLTLNGTITTSSTLFSGITLAATGGITDNGAIDIASGGVTVSSPLTIDAPITTAGGAVAFSSGVILNGNVTIDTTNAGAAPAGASVSFASTVDGATAFADNLTILAGTSGNVGFAGRVGHDNTLATGTTVGAVAIQSANAINLTMSTAGFDAASFASTSQSFAETAGYLSTRGASSASLPTNGGAISITTTGAGGIAIGGEVSSGGGVNTTTGAGGNGGAITINAGTWSVGIGTALTLTTTGSGPSLVPGDSSVGAVGYDATASGQSPGNGGAISITGANINLPLGVYSRGGAEEVAGSTAAGGLGASLTLTATGSVTVGIPTGANATGNAVSADSGGGSSTAGNAGNGANITIQGAFITLGKVLADAGGSGAASGTAANGGSITIISLASAGAGVTLYGEADAPTAATINYTTFSTRGSNYGATEIDPYFYSGGTITGGGGNITIEGPGSTPLGGTSYVQLATSAAASLDGGSTVMLFASGATGAGGTISILGPIQGTTANTESLRIRDANGTTTVAGAVGTSTALNTLAFGQTTSASPGTITFDGAVTAGTEIIDLRDLATDALVFGGLVTTPNFTQVTGSETVAMNGGGTFSGSFSSDTQPLTFGGIFTFTNTFDLSGPLSNNITLSAATTFDFSALSPTTGIDGTVNGTTPGGQSLTVNMGTGSFTEGAAIGGIVPLGAVTINASGFTSGANVTTAGGAVAINTATAALGNSVTIDTTAGNTVPAGANVTFGGTLDGTSAGQQSLTIAAGTGGTITLTGLAGGNVPLGAVTLTDARAILLGVITGGGAFSQTGATVLEAAADRGINTTGGSLGMNSNAFAGANVTFNGTINSASGTLQGFQITAGSGTVTLNSSIGQSEPLGDFTLTDGMLVIGPNVSMAVEDFEQAGSTILRNGTTTIVTTGLSSFFNGTVDGTVAGQSALTFDGPGGDLIAFYRMGSSVPLGAVTFTDQRLLVYNFGGGGGITTAADAINETGATVLESGGSGGYAFNTTGGGNVGGAAISLNGAVTGVTSGQQNLTINAGASGTITLGGSVGGGGGNTALGALTMSDATLDLAPNITVTLGGTAFSETGSTILQGGGSTLVTISTSGGDIGFGGTLNGTTSGQQALTLNAGSGGDVAITGVIGGSVPIGALTIDAIATPPSLANGVASLENGGHFVVSPAFNVNGLSLGGDFTFSGAAANAMFTPGFGMISSTTIDTSANNGTISLGPVNAASAGVQSLTLNAGSGTVTLTGSLGGTTPLGAVTITASRTTADGDIITQQGAVAINGALTVAANTVIDTTPSTSVTPGADITLAGTVDGDTIPAMRVLTLNGGTAGAVTIDGAIGSVVPLGGLIIDGRSIALGGNVTTSGGPVTLNAPTSLTNNVSVDTTNNGADPSGGTIDLGGQVTGGSNMLALNAGGSNIDLSGVTSGGLSLMTPLTTLDGGTYNNGSGSYTFGNVALDGDLTFNQPTNFGPATILGPTTLTTPNLALDFTGTITGGGSVPFVLDTGTAVDTIVGPVNGVVQSTIVPQPPSNTPEGPDLDAAVQQDLSQPPSPGNDNTTAGSNDTNPITGNAGQTGGSTGTPGGATPAGATGLPGGTADVLAEQASALEGSITPTDQGGSTPGGANVPPGAGPLEALTDQSGGPGGTNGAPSSNGPTDTATNTESDQPGASDDGITTEISQSMGATPPQVAGGGKGAAGGRTTPLINGMLYQGPPIAPPQSTPHGVPPADQQYSSWGNEAFWQ